MSQPASWTCVSTISLNLCEENLVPFPYRLLRSYLVRTSRTNKNIQNSIKLYIRHDGGEVFSGQHGSLNAAHLCHTTPTQISPKQWRTFMVIVPWLWVHTSLPTVRWLRGTVIVRHATVRVERSPTRAMCGKRLHHWASNYDNRNIGDGRGTTGEYNRCTHQPPCFLVVSCSGNQLLVRTATT